MENNQLYIDKIKSHFNIDIKNDSSEEIYKKF